VARCRVLFSSPPSSGKGEEPFQAWKEDNFAEKKIKTL